MPENGDGGEAPRHHADTPQAGTEPDDGELTALLAAGPGLANRAGAISFLTLLVVIGTGLYFYLSGRGETSFPARLDADLLSQAEMTVSAMEDGSRLAVVPAWPQRLYASLRGDTALYAAAAFLGAILWGLVVQARSRRSAYLVHEKLSRDLAGLRKRVEELEKPGKAGGRPAAPDGADTKG